MQSGLVLHVCDVVCITILATLYIASLGWQAFSVALIMRQWLCYSIHSMAWIIFYLIFEGNQLVRLKIRRYDERQSNQGSHNLFYPAP